MRLISECSCLSSFCRAESCRTAGQLEGSWVISSATYQVQRSCMHSGANNMVLQYSHQECHPRLGCFVVLLAPFHLGSSWAACPRLWQGHWSAAAACHMPQLHQQQSGGTALPWPAPCPISCRGKYVLCGCALLCCVPFRHTVQHLGRSDAWVAVGDMIRKHCVGDCGHG